MDKKLRALIVDDSDDDTLLLVLELRRNSYDAEYRRVDTAPDMREALQREVWDIILADYTMPQFSAMAALSIVQASGLDLPFIVVSGNIGEDIAVAAMKAGAHDYIMKNSLKRLVPAIERELRDFQVRRERKRAEERLAYLAYYDPVTDLPNRSLLLDRMSQALAYGHRHDSPVAVMFLDLDRFKAINDTFGHAAGDQLLKVVAQRLTHYVRESDTVARLGGDEFVVVITEMGHLSDAIRIAQGILQVMADPVVIEGQELYISASIGIAVYPNDGNDIPTLLKKADAALYRAKELGRNNYQAYTQEMDVKAATRVELENDLRSAFDKGQFKLLFQPKTSLLTGKITGAEALLRWEHPQWGALPPAEFLPLLEESGMINQVGAWIMTEACKRNKAWQQQGLAPITVSVNVSARQIQNGALVETVAQALAESGLDAKYLELELTEERITQNIENSDRVLDSLRQMGVHLASDDFGTGFSSLSYLQRFPIGSVKIDTSFTTELPHSRESSSIALAVIAMAHSLNLRVVAEGVETPEQLNFLNTHGCDEVQGSLVCEPIAADKLEALLRNAGDDALRVAHARN